jgi:hypothetical protein
MDSSGEEVPKNPYESFASEEFIENFFSIPRLKILIVGTGAGVDVPIAMETAGEKQVHYVLEDVTLHDLRRSEYTQTYAELQKNGSLIGTEVLGAYTYAYLLESAKDADSRPGFKGIKVGWKTSDNETKERVFALFSGDTRTKLEVLWECILYYTPQNGAEAKNLSRHKRAEVTDPTTFFQPTNREYIRSAANAKGKDTPEEAERNVD